MPIQQTPPKRPSRTLRDCALIKVDRLEDLANLPADTLVSYDSFGHLMLGTHRQMVEASARLGKFVPWTRMTRKAPMLFKAGDVAAYIAERLAALEEAK